MLKMSHSIFSRMLNLTVSNCSHQIRSYAVPKRKLVKKEYFVYEKKMKSRYKANPFPRLKMLLLEDVNKIGMKGDVVEVKRSIGRNKLIPGKLALYAIPENLLKHGIDPAILKESSGTKVPNNVVGYLKKHPIEFSVPSITNDFKELLITRHDVAEYFYRHGNLIVPVHCIKITDTDNDIITDFGEYIVEITINNHSTIEVPLNVIQREVIEDNTS